MTGSMPTKQAHLLYKGKLAAFHVTTSCVRKAYLMDDTDQVRKKMVEAQFRQASQTFCIDVCAFSFMDNHIHLTVVVRPDLAKALTAEEVARLWCNYVWKRIPGAKRQKWTEEEIQTLAKDEIWIEKRRKRLCSISWFMRLTKQRIAIMANRMDDCSGHFWEGRFHSTLLPTQKALIGSMIYDDLNYVRAAITDLPEDSDFCSIQRRIDAKLAHASRLALARSKADEQKIQANLPDEDLWIKPTQHCSVAPGLHPGIQLDAYIKIVDETGRLIKNKKRGYIPKTAPPILERLGFCLDDWIACMSNPKAFTGHLVGDEATRITYAAKAGLKWIADKTGLFRAA